MNGVFNREWILKTFIVTAENHVVKLVSKLERKMPDDVVATTFVKFPTREITPDKPGASCITSNVSFMKM